MVRWEEGGTVSESVLRSSRGALIFRNTSNAAVLYTGFPSRYFACVTLFVIILFTSKGRKINWKKWNGFGKSSHSIFANVKAQTN
jgi:hypothetical protein